MSFWWNYYHLLWETHQRASLLVPSIESELDTFIINQAAKIEVNIYAISSAEDHLHLVAAIPPELSVSQVVEDIKHANEDYINDLLPTNHPTLAWEQGYGFMTFGEGQLADAVRYVKIQSLLHLDDQTNAWLERADNRNEGPIDPGLSPKIAALLRESQSDYEINMDEPPF